MDLPSVHLLPVGVEGKPLVVPGDERVVLVTTGLAIRADCCATEELVRPPGASGIYRVVRRSRGGR